MTPRSPVTRHVPALLLGAVLTIGTLTGCQSTTPDYGAETAEQFQATVLSVTQSVADGDLQTARATLVAFDSELDSAAADGSVSFARHKRIDAALDAVLADVDAAILAQTPAPEPEPEVVPETVAPTAPVTNDPGESDEEDGDDEGDEEEHGNNGNNGPEDKGPKAPKDDKGPKNDKGPKKDKPNK